MSHCQARMSCLTLRWVQWDQSLTLKQRSAQSSTKPWDVVVMSHGPRTRVVLQCVRHAGTCVVLYGDNGKHCTIQGYIYSYGHCPNTIIQTHVCYGTPVHYIPGTHGYTIPTWPCVCDTVISGFTSPFRELIHPFRIHMSMLGSICL